MSADARMHTAVRAERSRKSSDDNGLAGEAYVIVRERILRGELAMGQVISRRKVAAELGMSFLPVSEALLRLEHEGLLESRPRAGTRVRVPTRADVEGHYVVREALEAQSAMLFASHATRDERSELLKLAARLDALLQQPDGNRFIYLTLHEKLHRRVAECTRCAALSDAISRVCAFASTWLCAMRPVLCTQATHESLMKVLISADPATAAEAMRVHIRSGMEQSLRSLEPYFELQRMHPQNYARTPRKRIHLESLLARTAQDTV